jgi:ribosome inactivating protein
MSHPDVTTAPEEVAEPVKRAPFGRVLRRFRSTAVLATVLAAAAVVSHVETPSTSNPSTSSVQAEGVHGGVKLVQNQTPVFWWNGNRWDYFAFINNIRASVNGYNNWVPGSSNTIDHTDVWNNGPLDVVIVDRHGSQLRVRLRRSDLYVLGWWDRNGVYQYLGPGWDADIPPGTPPNLLHQALDTPSYDGMERMANLNGGGGQGRSRYNARFNQDTVSASAAALFNADFSHPELIGQGLLVLVQFISEATRFRGISDAIGWGGFGNNTGDNWAFNTTIPAELVGQENSWGQMSERYNWMLENNAQDSWNNAFTGYWRNPDGTTSNRRLITMADYGNVFNCVRGFPGRR